MRQRLKKKPGETSLYIEIRYVNKRDNALIAGNLQLSELSRAIGRRNRIVEVDNLRLQPNKYDKQNYILKNK